MSAQLPKDARLLLVGLGFAMGLHVVITVRQYKLYSNAVDLANYYAQKLKDNGIEPDEFDIMVMNTLNPES